VPGQVPETGNAVGNANDSGGEIPQEPAEGENPAQQQQGNAQGNANVNNAPPPPPLPAPRAAGNAGNPGNGNGNGREPDEGYTDGETDEEEFYDVAPGQIRYNDNLIQYASLNTPVQGLSGVLTHLSKPINVALSRRYRDDPEHASTRARKHMSKITQDYVQEALGKEHVIVQQQHAIESLINMMTSLKAEFSELQHSHRTAVRAAVEKLNVLEPNPFSSYPHHDTSDDVFIKAITVSAKKIAPPGILDAVFL
jgi:hypothetical protein